jgi:Caspase domain
MRRIARRVEWGRRAGTPWRAAALWAWGLVLAAGPFSADAKRVALVIGNDSYQNAQVLLNARSDAKAMAKALESSGFSVTLKQDLTLKAMKEALRAFKAEVAGGDDALFYFSGHGVQFEGSNYLIPVDVVAQSEEQVADDSLGLQRVLDDLRDQKARFTLAIIDACRENPFKGAGRGLSRRGLAPVTAATGQMVLYSAGAGQEALDRLGPHDADPNGVFTRVFIREIKKPGVPADQILKNVRDQVVQMAKSIDHEQVPALYDQSIGEFYFNSKGLVAAAPQPDSRHVETAEEREQSYWDRIKDSDDPADFNDYKKQYPTGPHLGEAALLLRKLNRPPELASVKLNPVPAAAPAAAPQVTAQAHSPVDASVQGTWMQMVPNPHGVSTWYWEIRANGTYAFWSIGPGAVAPHTGTLLAAEGKWATNSPSWVDGGTYQVPNANTLVANGRLGTGYWHRGP